MIKVIFSLIFTLICAGKILHAGDGVCHKCEVIREENKKKVNPYEFYEDYRKANPEQNPSETNKDKDKGNTDKRNTDKRNTDKH